MIFPVYDPTVDKIMEGLRETAWKTTTVTVTRPVDDLSKDDPPEIHPQVDLEEAAARGRRRREALWRVANRLKERTR